LQNADIFLSSAGLLSEFPSLLLRGLSTGLLQLLRFVILIELEDGDQKLQEKSDKAEQGPIQFIPVRSMPAPRPLSLVGGLLSLAITVIFADELL